MKKLLSIIIPIYNSERTIGRTLESLNRISQESKELTEVVIVDDGSQDRSPEIVELKKNELLPLNLVILKQQNQGTAAARNTGLEQCKGEWIFFLDADDELAFDPITYIQKSPDASALGFSVKFYKDLKCRGIRHPVLVTLKNHLDIFTAGNGFTASSIVFKREQIRSMFDTDFIYMEDWLFWIKNPLIFEDMKIFRREISAIINLHERSKSSHYIMNGKYRKKVADKILDKFSNRLTYKQRNNLLIQSRIGLIQQKEKITLDTFLLFPCNALLYAKLIIFFLLRGYFAKFDLYGR
jgi:glycosyltransferase involved in cell wall biosynthesis